ncbi:Mg2+ transport protein [Spiroplasma sabaudiense Ar-1343]|uniref:Magnesium transporter MgtE n=1 Tax=Spiroplasma sabaudiense Ar-1343 TaxID=1276257 RepID=W6A944_9MOLU|nr:magnesium transporter [Spiroplasma sabaudiense]AHI53486.1 Mg2+ transport protein [Spiroplasma sabaudiense Ar-1343]
MEMTEVKQIEEQIIALFKKNDLKEIKKICESYPLVDIAEALAEIEHESVLKIIRLLEIEDSSHIFIYLGHKTQEYLVRELSNAELKPIIKDIYVDDVIDIIDELPAELVKKVLKLASQEVRMKVNQILEYDETTAGAIMSVEFIKLQEEVTVQEAINEIRKLHDANEENEDFFVVDKFDSLKGTVKLKDLVFNNEKIIISEIMDKRLIYAQTTTDQEEVADIFKKYDIETLPILNSENKLAGIITVDDVIDVIEEENTEDIHKMGGIKPLEDSYFDNNIWKMVGSRAGWLTALMLSATIVQIIIIAFMVAFKVNDSNNNLNSSTYVMTMILMPLLVVVLTTASNSGNQSSTMIARSIALKEIKTKDYFKVVWKELRVSVIIGLILVICNFLRMLIVYAVQFKGDINNVILWTSIAVTSIALFISVVISKLIGSTLPLIAKFIKIDAAIFASPIITTIVDILSSAIFLGIAFAMYSPILGI